MAYVVILVALYIVISALRSLKSKNSDVQGAPINGEIFPKIDVYNQMEPQESYECIGNPGPAAVKSKPKKKIVQEKISKIAATPETVTDKDETKKILLKSRSEARRAFIHSEILKRKY